MNDFFSYTFLDNSVERWSEFLLLILLTYVFKKYLSTILGTILYQPFRKFSTENEGKKFVALLAKPIEFFVLFFTAYAAFKSLHYPTVLQLNSEELDLKSVLNQVVKTIGAFAILWVVLRIIDFLSFVFYQKYSSHDSVVDQQIVPFIKDSLKVIISIIAFILVLSLIYKLNVAGVLAGLGIGGLAVALAAKESLENLLGSFTIFLDKPFHVGDVVQVGSVNGTVERVGFRSTRIRTDNKTFVTVPNKQIVDSVLDNITERTHRRAEMKLYLNQSTPVEILKDVLQKISEKLSSTELVEPEFTVLFNSINQASLEIIVVFLVKQSVDLKTFNQIKQQANFDVLNILKNAKVQLVSLDAAQKLI